MRIPKSLPDLPRKLWGLIFQHLEHPIDRLHFASVSSFFWSIAKENNPCRLSRALLMLPPAGDSDRREFFSLADKNIYQIHLPELNNKWCCGSSFGWLFAVDFHSGEISLLNPVTRETISLPHISTFTNPPKPDFDQDRNEIWYIKKAILSGPPTTGDFIVMAVFTNLWALAFCRPGDRNWTTLTKDYGPCEDVTYYEEKFYAITNWGALVAWDLRNAKEPELTVLIEPTHELPYFRYLVELPNGELLKISRLEDENALTIGFKVYKLDEEKKEWMETNGLANHALFLGYNRAVGLAVQENPKCLANCIYFTEDDAEKYYYQEDGCNDVGVCRLEDGRIEEFYQDHPFWRSHCIWVTPTLKRSVNS